MSDAEPTSEPGQIASDAGPIASDAGPIAEPAPKPLAIALALVLALTIFVFARPSTLLDARRIDLRAQAELAPVAPGVARARFPLGVLFRIPLDAELAEDGRPLEWTASTASVAQIASGAATARFATAGRMVVLASTDGSDPATNGRRYELAFAPDRLELARSLPFLVLLAAAAAIFLVALREGVVVTRGPSPLAHRLALALGAVLTLAIGEAGSWDRIAFDGDSASYLNHSVLRSSLYPGFVDAFDREPASDRPSPPRSPRPAIEPTHRFAGVVHAQRLATICALGLLLFALATRVNAWLLAGVFAFGVLVDVEHLGGDCAVWWNVGSIMSEGINHALVFAFLAGLFLYLARAHVLTGALFAVPLGLLLWNRPANLGLAVAFVAIFVVDRSRVGAKRATVRAAGLAAVVALPLVLACAATYHAHGRFRLHAFTGPSLFSVALQGATADDVETFDDPELRELARACVSDPRRVGDFHASPNGDYLNVNLYEIGFPAAAKIAKAPPRDLPFVEDDRLRALATRFIARHPLAYARLVLFHFRRLLEPNLAFVLAEALAAAIALALWRRTGAPEAGFALALALLPVVYMAPACLFNFPSERYHSQVYFADWLALPFALAVASSLRDCKSLNQRSRSMN